MAIWHGFFVQCRHRAGIAADSAKDGPGNDRRRIRHCTGHGYQRPILIDVSSGHGRGS